MSYITDSIPEAIERLSRRDRALEEINLYLTQYTDAELAELVDCLLANPDVVRNVYLIFNQLTDETGIKLARYVATSTTIRWLDLSDNQFGETTYLALAAALRINMSLQYLGLYDNQIVDGSRINCIDTEFINALILNPNRPGDSDWGLYSYDQNEFERLKNTAEQQGHPSMQALLAITIY